MFKKISFSLMFLFFLAFFNLNNIEASYCEYNSNIYSNVDGTLEGADIKIRITFDANNFSWQWSNYDGSNIEEDTRNFYPLFSGTLWQKSFDEEQFRNYIDEYGKCPNLAGIADASYMSYSLQIGDGINNANVYLSNYEFDSGEDEPKILAEYGTTYTDEFGDDYLKVRFYVTDKGKEMMSLSNSTTNAGDVEVTSSGAVKVIEVDNHDITVVIYPEQVDEIFSYTDSNDLSTLRKKTVYLNVVDSTTRTYELSIESGGYADSGNENLDRITSSDEYVALLGQLKPPLNALSASALNIPLIVDGNDVTLNDIAANNNLCSGNDCVINAEYLTQTGLKEIRSYCNSVYEIYGNHQYNNIDERMDECISFNSFYEELVSQNIINDLSSDCAILSDDLVKILTDILDIVKIAGPLLALGLGMLDFIKVIVHGDADKEMKTAFKRFLTRIIAAVLLFLVPLILAFLLDLFLGNQDGYNSDNPFCDVVDWSNQ